MIRYVYDFTDGGQAMANLLGGKGAHLAEMTRMGLPVPPGFTITTQACRTFLTTGNEPEQLTDELADHLASLEETMGRRLGDPNDPLLLSVRSGAQHSMPGMMETILDVGLNDTTVRGLAEVSGNADFAWDSYRRLLQMYGATVLGVAPDLFASKLAQHPEPHELPLVVEKFKEVIKGAADEEFPQDPTTQLRRAVRAVFLSWNGERAKVYRRREHISEDLGTAVTVQAMVYGNLGSDSGTGVAFTHDPATGHEGVYGDYLPNAQGEDVVSGIRNAIPVKELERIDPVSFHQLQDCLLTLTKHYRDLCDTEFTIERGKLWMLQTRIGKRTAEAAFRIAAHFIDEDVITPDEVLGRVTGEQLGQLMFPRFDTAQTESPLAFGIPASPGAAVGAAVFDSSEAVRRAGLGEEVVLVRHETSPDDLPGMIAARAVLTGRGGKTSHAAVVARGMGRVCVCGTETLTINASDRAFTTADGTRVTEGTVISVDGTTGAVYLGALPLVESDVMRYFEYGEETTALSAAVAHALERADHARRLDVRANADTPADAARARRFGATGIGLCRTEHMFLGERRHLVEAMILASTDADRQQALDDLLLLQRDDFTEILAAMDGLPVTIRLLDPPLHEFLPDRTELTKHITTQRATGATPDAHEVRLLDAVERLDEHNPMLGLRGVRLGLVTPGLYAMQARAVGEAVARRRRDGGEPRAEIMIPLVGTASELSRARDDVTAALTEVSSTTGIDVHCPIGTMIELPRAALTSGAIARHADFFSLGTNDLTQTTWGLSRDDAEASFLPAYLAQGICDASPFERLDVDGVGRLVTLALEEGRAAHPGLPIGVCGEHGGDPYSIHFFDSVGVDYVSCSPYRVPVARLEAGRARYLQR
ncbi:pyruvate, phosphate dikinase [Streptomyces lydicus]|uniref:Pyruvate, phosphate dikinase n=1 Tax=Streptomyces lydicus TaxID=47763 RepID=A0A3S9Y4A4_9ACTN|nr:pyruvate, phosphate dikinase [Streptomyces lydicus]AZS69837.1 pyruvate, phosphate dikinase [Streptomyces lydicus]